MSRTPQPCQLLLVLLLAALPQVATAQLRAVPVATGLTTSVGMVAHPSVDGALVVIEQHGVLRLVVPGQGNNVFLNLADQVAAGGERGLLGVAFPPDHAVSRRFYVYYTRRGTEPGELGDIVIARYRSNGVYSDVLEKHLVFEGLPYIEHSEFENHNGGHMAFGPDGYLYIGVGDGGGGNDPRNNAQNPATLLGKILRIDVGVPDDHPQGYVIPPDNPFANGGGIGARPEIWAFGVRNPWKFSFDDGAGGTGALLIADVGQSGWEEINYEPAGSGGRNYGWRNREGTHDNQPFVSRPVPPAYAPLTDPVYEYGHSVGESITGGFVYRGRKLLPYFTGRYFFADFAAGRVWSLGLARDPVTGEATATNVLEHTAELGGSASLGAISAFGRDRLGELYVVSYAGTIYRIESTADAQRVDTVFFNANGDSFKDVLLYNQTTGAWSVQHGTAAGEFTVARSGGWATGWTIFVANFDADPFDDLFLYSESTGVWVKVFNNGSSFSYFSQGWRPGFSVFVRDLDGNGRSDVFLYDATSGVWVICITAGTGRAGFTYAGGGWRPGFQLVPGDFDADRRSDFLLYNPLDGVFCKAMIRSASTFDYSCGGWAAGWQPFVVELNGDGFADVLLYSPLTATYVRATSVSDGTAGFSYAAGEWLPAWGVKPADFDGDGRSDVFLHHANGMWVKVLNAGPFFTYVSGGWTAEWTSQVVDLNGDGKDDVFLLDLITGIWVRALTTTPGAFTYSTGRFLL